MTIQEFEDFLQHSVSQEDFADINFVYNFHPSISETKGKEQIVILYQIGGMRIIADMMNTAIEARDLEDEIADLRGQLERTIKKMSNLKNAKYQTGGENE
jgi:hypothetical protein